MLESIAVKQPDLYSYWTCGRDRGREICSSNSEGSTAAAIPASASRARASTSPVIGPDEATSGLLSVSPR